MSFASRTTLLLLLLPATAAKADSLSVSRLPRLPIPLTNNAVTSWEHDGQVSLFSFMGIQDPRQRSSITAAAFRLDLPDGSWTPITDAPRLNSRGKIGASAVTVGDDICLIDGYTDRHLTMSNSSSPPDSQVT